MMYYSEYPENSIEDFEVYEILGRGGFARVYRAKSLKTDQEVAIKIIDKKMMHHHGMTTRVRKEVELHSRLKHPSILELYTFFEDANYVYLVLEMCHNGELHRKIRENGPLSEDQARKYLKQIIDGLKYLHSYNILHRDLTLANLLLTKDMKVKIADFGLATQLEIGVEHFTMCGTPNYISPEVVSRSKQGLEADVWSVGCMLYTMLVGKAPFDTKEIKGTLNRVQIGKFHLPSNISETAKQLITGLLQTNPDKRLNLQELSVHGFMQINKNSDLFQDLSITDSGIGSMNKGHSSIDSRYSLRERNVFVNNLSQHKDQESPRYKNSTKIVESVSEIIDHQNLKGNNCSNCKNILQDSSVNKSSSDKCGYHSLFSNSVSQSSHSPYTSNINNQVSNIGNQSHSNNQKMNNSSSDTSYQNILSESGSNSNNNNNNNICKKKPESLNSKRLRPIRQKTRNAILNILDDETVCVEFIKSLSDSNDSKNLLKVCEVMCIDVLGQSILVYYPEKIAPVDIDKPIPLESGNKVSHFLLESIPEKYIKKYELAKKFVDLVRSKTPKLTVYTELGKCMLMENDPCPDFEIIFNVNVTVKFDSDMRSVNKIHLFGNCNKCQFFFIDDTNITIDSDSSSSQISSSINKWLDYSNKCKDYCLKVIRQINSISNSNNIVSSLFPMTIGRKTLSLNDTTGKYFHSDLVSAENLPLSILDSLSLQLKLSTPRLPASNNINLNNSYISEQSTSTFIPEIGWATQFANGELKVQFNDGCQLVIVYDSSTIEKIKWFSVNSADQSNNSTIKEFSKTDILPDEVHSKIELLPLFVKKLRNNCLQSQPRLS